MKKEATLEVSQVLPIMQVWSYPDGTQIEAPTLEEANKIYLA